jgi:tetratricopeptide (TPR) repeat protein
MQRLNSAQSLLDQHQKESDDQVKTKLFVALGAACSSAISGPPAGIPVTIKKIRSTTLELAAKHYLFSEGDEKARYAAEVIRKLLVRNGLESEDVSKYLNLLSTRYNDEKDKPNAALRGVLLNAMAGLCAPESTCRTKAHNLFRSQFTEALQDKDNYVRETAVNGLSYIDKKAALELLRVGFYNDPSEALRKKWIALAGEVGDENDLNNLTDKIGKNSEGELAWQAMMSIFRRLDESKVAVWKEWVGKLASGNGGYSNEQRIAFFKNAETKAPGATKLEARKSLGNLYFSAGQFENAADYFNKLYEAAQKPNEKDAILKKLLDASLKGDQLGRVTALVGNHLSKSDLDPNGVIILLLNGYLGKPPLGENQKAVIKALEEIKVSQERPKWQQWLDGWKAILSKDEEKEPDKPKPTTG